MVCEKIEKEREVAICLLKCSVVNRSYKTKIIDSFTFFILRKYYLIYLMSLT